MSNFEIGNWVSQEEMEKRLQEKRRREELQREWDRQQREKRIKEMEERKKRKDDLLTSEDPTLDEEGYIEIQFCPPNMSEFDLPETIEVKCTKRYKLLLEEGFIRPEEMPSFREALNEEGFDLDEEGNVVESEESIREWEAEMAYYYPKEYEEKK